MTTLRQLGLICCVLIFANPTWAGRDPAVRVALTRSPLQVLELPLEDYLLGVLVAEVNPAWPAAALRAQAVAARTYALYRLAHPKGQDFDLEAGVGDQAYRWLPEYPEPVRRALRATRGQVLWWEGKTIPAFFHSCSGGHTESAQLVWRWAKAWPFYQAKPDPYCRQCPDQAWEHVLAKVELTHMLQSEGLAGGAVDYVVPLLSDNGSRRVHEIVVITDAETLQLPSNRLRQLIGFDRLRSTRFNILDREDQLVFLGSGKGHGVGMCQWGAKAMSDIGKSYRDILEFYYPGVEIRRVY